VQLPFPNRGERRGGWGLGGNTLGRDLRALRKEEKRSEVEASILEWGGEMQLDPIARVRTLISGQSFHP